jgi:hypothetical protein
VGNTQAVLSRSDSENREAALAKYEEITRRFTTTFETSESAAYGGLLKDLMDWSSLLIAGQIMSAKEILDKTEDLQVHLKKAGGGGGMTMGDMFHLWLDGKEITS